MDIYPKADIVKLAGDGKDATGSIGARFIQNSLKFFGTVKYGSPKRLLILAVGATSIS
jgi:hypothetical protein